MDARRVLGGRYELAEVLGRGGMGAVYRAQDLLLQRDVAVKMLPWEFAEGDPVVVERFQREARAAASLAHPGVVAVYDTGVDAGTRFIVMEYVGGRSLEALLREDGRLAAGRAVEIASGVAGALGAAHAAGIVHRDIKPGNVMLADDGSVKVLDFGIARALDSTTLTHSASVLGTASYMAPEQVRGERADERSDIYSLGCVIYAMIDGRPPFTGESAAAILHQQVNLAPTPLREGHPRTPAGLDTLVLQMLAKIPEQRPQSGAEVRERLAQASRNGHESRRAAVAATKREPSPPRAHAAEDSAARRLLARDPPTRRRRRVLAGALVAALALAGLALALFAGGGGAARARRTAKVAPTTRKRTTRTDRATTSKTSSTAATAPPASTGTGTPASTTAATPPAPTVAASAGALVALLTHDVEGGSIEAHAAQQLGNEVAAILNSYEMGHSQNLPHEFANLTQQLAQLEAHALVGSAAAPALRADLSSLQSALANATPITTGPSAPGAPGTGPKSPVLPQHGPKAKHHGHHPPPPG